jgi:ketosteroid isomerase-like protein
VRGADAGFLDQLYRDDLVLVSSRGEIVTKQQEVEEVRTGAVRYRKFDTWDIVPRVFGDVAVVTALTRIEAIVTATQREIAVDLRVIDVFVRSGGTWRVLATQATRLGT